MIEPMKYGMGSHGLWELGWQVLAEGVGKRHVEWEARSHTREGLDEQLQEDVGVHLQGLD